MAFLETTTTPRKLKLTKSAVAALPVPAADKPAVYWDSDTPGLGVRISPAGRRTYFLQGRTRAGRGVKITLGVADRITADQAREAAKKHLAALALGRDPAAELQAKRQAERDRRQAVTVLKLWADFEANHVAGLRPKSQKAYRSWYGNHIAPALGGTKVGNLNRGRVEDLLKAVAAESGRSTANRVHAVISAMLSYGEGVLERTGARRFPDAVNVARGIKAHAEPGRERELSEQELARLISRLDRDPALEARLVEFLLATAARRGEALAARWCDVDLSAGWWTKPAATTKGKRTHRIPLNAAARAVLAKLDQRGDELFGGITENRLSRWWLRTRAELKLGDLHLHDLRHASASLMVSAGVPLYTVAKMLGHAGAGAAITARYSHITDRALSDAAALVGDRLNSLRDIAPAGHA
jgi:integrase